jgi:hypothetical protein
VNRTASETPPAGVSPYTGFADLNGDGRINATDVGAVRARLNDQLPALPGAQEVVPAASVTREIFSSVPIL